MHAFASCNFVANLASAGGINSSGSASGSGTSGRSSPKIALVKAASAILQQVASAAAVADVICQRQDSQLLSGNAFGVGLGESSRPKIS